ncbi:MAG: membrane integrity-associated transporter subunit PqiC, partial [Proteobacteria bacterium]|nr:membrane integrity-associated transporter subunit PqiC [Pseudomonadota bacterium]
GPVAGLSKGSAVNFNGVRVGEVTAMILEASTPGEVAAEIAIDRAAPVRADSRASIDFQGLAGAPAVALSGGTAALPLLASAPPGQRVLRAEKDAGQGMTQVARTLLKNLDTVVSENAEPLKSAIASIDKFATALARNSDKVDGILAGLDRLTGGGPKVQPRVFELRSPTAFPTIAAFPSGQMLVPEVTALANLETDKILVIGDEPNLGDVRWADMLPRLVQTGIARTLENAGFKKAIAKAPEGAQFDYQLLIEVRRFHVVSSPSPSAAVELSARLLKSGGAITDVQVFRGAADVQRMDADGAVAGLNEAFGKAAVQLVLWAFGAA